MTRSKPFAKIGILLILAALLLQLAACSRPLPAKPGKAQTIQNDYRLTVTSSANAFRKKELDSARVTLAIEYIGDQPSVEVTGAHTLGGFYLCDEKGEPLEPVVVLDEQTFFTFSADQSYERSWDCGDALKAQKPGTYRMGFYADFTETAAPGRHTKMNLTLPLEIRR